MEVWRDIFESGEPFGKLGGRLDKKYAGVPACLLPIPTAHRAQMEPQDQL